MLKSKNILVAFYGIVNIFVFFLLGVFGGFYDSLQILVFREVSFTISPYAPTKGTSVPLYFLYNITLLLFSIFLSIRLRSYQAKMGALSLIFAALAGLALLVFPIDPPLSKLTIQGTSHNIIAILLSLYTVLAINLFAQAFRKNKHLKKLAKQSVNISLFILAVGILTGISAFLNKQAYVGFLQKFAMGAFLFWLLITSIGILQSDRRVRYI